MIAEACWACIVGLHEECFEAVADEDRDGMWTCCCARNPDPDAQSFNTVGRPVKDPSDITDVTSTGRKRAGMLYPIMADMECEWAWLARAGGGIHPIVGCAGNRIDPVKVGPRAGHRHHGPDKNTIANDPLNVHRICTTCHARWHALNNRYYDEPRPATDQQWLPTVPEGEILHRHDPDTIATEEDRDEDSRWWATSKADRGVVTED